VTRQLHAAIFREPAIGAVDRDFEDQIHQLDGVVAVQRRFDGVLR
jgi:hypothetical protein